ncbi:TPA: hypothetical protein SLG65_002754 [Proteus mirabilis]|nr:hypothetical protein [Proteus mirabilis]HEI8757764.1 hypothetical protein [Proteus mirabilis]
MDKSRRQFEEWINKNHPKCSGYHKDIRFEAWQASRDSLVLDLPAREKNKGNYDYFTDGYNRGISACEISLLDNGVKIKDE